MTHEYTILTGGTVLAGAGEPEGQAIAWAWDTVLLVGPDELVRAISRGDSHFLELRGRFVIPLGDTDDPIWPADTTLEPGTPADFAVVDGDPRLGPTHTLAVVRAGRVVAGSLGGPAAGEGAAHQELASPSSE
jgi:predicted amidohydrolase YtcJ